MMKVCEHCGQEYTPVRSNQKYCTRLCEGRSNRPIIRKPLTEEAKVKASKRANKSKRLHRLRLSDTIVAIKSKAVCPCGKCDSDPDVMLFHHRDPKTKCFSISWGVKGGVSEVRLLAEIAKCDIICTNYHIKLHKLMRRSGTPVYESSDVLDPRYKRQMQSVERSRQKKGLVIST